MTGPALPIDHSYIEANNVAARFVRGELTQQERDAFERHYVDCSECMDRVALAQIFHVETQTQAARKRVAKKPIGIFNILATFPPRQQALIFAASTLGLLLMPVMALNWMANRPPADLAESELVVQLPASGSAQARIPPGTIRITISAVLPDQTGTYRLSIVDVSNRALVTGADQIASQGMSLGLRLTSLPPGVTFAVVEKKAENGAYAMVSRVSLLIEWR